MTEVENDDRTAVYTDPGAPTKVGVILDMPSLRDSIMPIYDMVIEQYRNAGKIDRRIKLVTREVKAAPSGYIQDVVRAHQELVDEGALIIIGGNIADNNHAVVGAADRSRVATITLGAHSQLASQYAFSLSMGAIPEDVYMMLSWIARNRHKRLTVTWDGSWHANEYMHYLRIAARRMGLKILADERFTWQITAETDKAMARTVEEHRALKPDAIMHFSTGNSALHWAKAVREAKWDIPRVMNFGSVFMSFPGLERALDGWVGVSMWDEENPTLAKLLSDLKARYPDMPAVLAPEFLGSFRDVMTVVLEAIMLAPIQTAEGVYQGLEQIHLLPSALGGPRTTISFGPYDRRGHKGMDIMLLRRSVDGRPVKEGYFEPFL